MIEDKNPEKNPSSPEGENHRHAHLASRKIAVFDRDRDSLRDLGKAVEGKGYEVTPWDGEREPIEFLLDSPPYAVITEADLGDRTGFDLCREIKKESRLSSVPVIFVSAESGLPGRAEAVRSGSDAFLAKPLVPEALIETLQLTGSASPKVPVRVLAVEDDAVQIAFLRGVLENAGFIFEACADPEGLFDALDSFNPDIMILDVKLPRYSGYELARILRQDESYMTLPIIFLTVSGEDSDFIEGLQAGSDDYLIKPVNPQILINCVRFRSKRSLLMRTLTDQDGLTRLLNRASLMRHLESVFSRAGRYQETLSVAMIDIDHFKGINDTHGHQAGDWVLRDLSQFLRDALRKSDLIGRYGGEEFLVLFPRLEAEEAEIVMDRVRREYEKSEQSFPAGKAITVTFSCGIAAYPDCGTSLDAVIAAADGALYEAKRAGRNRVSVAGA